jgi:hypothetical protein
MANLFGIDLGPAIDAIGSAVGGLTSGMQSSPIQGKDPFAVQGQIQAKDPYQGLTYGGGPFAVLGESGKVGGSDPFKGITGYLGGDPLGGYQSDTANMFNQNPGAVLTTGRAFSKFDQANGAAAQAAAAREASTKQIATMTGQLTPGGPSMDFSGPATSDDNQGITGAQIDQFIASKFKNSPLVGTGEAMLQIANKEGVSVLMLLGIGWKESGMGSNVGRGNIFGMKDGPDSWIKYSDPLAEIQGAAKNLAGGTYRGKSAAEQMGAWYVGPQAYATQGLNATDGAGNGTVGDYLNNFIAPTYAAFGKGFNATQAPTQRAPAAGAPYTGGGGQLASMFGGVFPGANQEYGAVTPGIDQGIYGYGAAYGLPQGHTGVDINTKRGAQLYMPAGLTGVVETAGGTPYFRDEDYGDHGTPGKGELRIRLSNGDIVIFGHTSAIQVQAGQQVTGGMGIALGGSANGDHTHLEVRVRQPDGSYRLVNPLAYFGAQGGAPQNAH